MTSVRKAPDCLREVGGGRSNRVQFRSHTLNVSHILALTFIHTFASNNGTNAAGEILRRSVQCAGLILQIELTRIKKPAAADPAGQ